MATQVIDAFLVTFGIDTTPLDRDKHDVERKNRDIKDSTRRTFTEMEASGKSLGLTFRNVRNELAGMLVLFTGGKSMLDFATGMIRSEANAGRLGETIGVTTSKLIAWQQAVKGQGGAPGEADAAIQTAARWKMDWKLQPQNVPQAELARLGINANDLERLSPDELLLKLSAARSRMRATEFSALLQRVGLPQSVIYLLDQGTKRLREQIREHERNANVTEQDARAAQELEQKLAELESTIMGKVRPSLTGLVDGMNNFLDSGEGVAKAMPAIIAAVGLLGGAALAALGPWGRLAALMGVVLGYMDKMVRDSPETQGWLDWLESPLHGILPDWMFDRNWGMGGAGAGRGGARGGGNVAIPQSGPVSDLFNVLEGEFGTERARGIWAGIGAESQWDPNAKNPTSGAYGLGQWLGPRKKELFRRYGNNPTAAQQMEFLIWELKGGDRGGSKVLGTTTADHALLAYITSFMRPAAGAETLGDISRGRQYLYGRGAARSTGGSVNIGSMTIQTQATDAQGIARDMHGALKARNIVTQVDAGVAP